MASISFPKARKEYLCSKCGKTISVGEKYAKGEPFRQRPIIRCISCGVKSYEVSSSDYVQSIGPIVEDWTDNYPISDGASCVENIITDLEGIRDDLQDRYDNIPENLQCGEVAETIQSRMDCLDDAISELESIDYDSIVEEIRDEMESNLAEDEELDEDELQDKVDEALEEAISEALSGIEY